MSRRLCGVIGLIFAVARVGVSTLRHQFWFRSGDPFRVDQGRARRDLPSRRITQELRQEIVAGALAPGEKLPPERQLAAKYGIARNTAREAVRILAEEGLVTSEHGRGVLVREKPRVLRFGAERYSHHLRETTGLSPYRAEVAKRAAQRESTVYPSLARYRPRTSQNA